MSKYMLECTLGSYFKQIKVLVDLAKNRSKIVKNLEFLSKKFKMVNRLQLCLSYVKAFKWINFIIVGVDNLSQLKDIVKMKKKKKLSNFQINLIISKMKNLATDRLLKPYKW